MKYLVILFCVVLFLALLPVMFWQFGAEKPLEVAILDKTVPNETRREHHGLVYLLNHLRYVKADGSPYALETDYFGFYPDDSARTHTERPLPRDLSGYDVVYLADTYGVYEEDLPYAQKTREGSRSPMIYGGLTDAEWGAIAGWLNARKDSLLIAEFNAFASPTGEVRENVMEYLGLEWKGWVGRYFTELDPERNPEIPQWIVEEYGDSWTYAGEGFLLVNDFTYEVLVLERARHLEKPLIHLEFTPAGEAQFGLKTSPDYHYWFDILTPRDGAVSLADYKWYLTDEGRAALSAKGIPERFSAVVRQSRGAASSYYFAGDFNDVSQLPGFYQARGLRNLYGLAERFSVNALYWQTYMPMMQSILESRGKAGLPGAGGIPAASAVPGAGREAVPGESAPPRAGPARVRDGAFQFRRGDAWETAVIKGVNMGMSRPGVFTRRGGRHGGGLLPLADLDGRDERQRRTRLHAAPPGVLPGAAALQRRAGGQNLPDSGRLGG